MFTPFPRVDAARSASTGSVPVAAWAGRRRAVPGSRSGSHPRRSASSRSPWKWSEGRKNFVHTRSTVKPSRHRGRMERCALPSCQRRLCGTRRPRHPRGVRRAEPRQAPWPMHQVRIARRGQGSVDHMAALRKGGHVALLGPLRTPPSRPVAALGTAPHQRARAHAAESPAGRAERSGVDSGPDGRLSRSAGPRGGGAWCAAAYDLARLVHLRRWCGSR